MGMGKSSSSISIVLLLAAMLAFSIGVEARKPASDIDAKLKLLNKPAVKTIKSEDGDILTALTFINSLLPIIQPLNTTKSRYGREVEAVQMELSLFAEFKRKISSELLLLSIFARKPAAQFRNSSNTKDGPNELPPSSPLLAPSANRAAAYLVTSLESNYIGAQADINLWNPHVDLKDDFTTGQIWLKAGNGPFFESVEAGWVADSYKSTGCFDLTCPGSVQTSHDVVLGAALQPVSSTFGPHYHITVVFLDELDHWWLKAGDTPVGYWPTNILGSLGHSAILVEWGGQVFSSQVRETPHTKRGMGSGDFADGLYGSACYMQNVRIKNYSQSLKYPEFVSTWAEEPYCYDSKNCERVSKIMCNEELQPFIECIFMKNNNSSKMPL